MAQSQRSASAYARAALLGVVAGMRTQLPLALLALAARHDRGHASVSTPRVLRSTPLQVIAGAAAVGELIGDKLPMTPSRLEPGPLAGRFMFGALAGGIVGREAGRSPLAGALLGAAGAGIGAYAGYHVRAGLGRATHLPDPLFGAAEDVVAIGLGVLASRGVEGSASRRVGEKSQ